MKKLKTKHNFFRKPAVITGIVVVFIAALAGGFWWYAKSNQSTDTTVNYSGASEEEKEGGKASKKESIETESQDKSTSSGSDQQTTPSDTTDGKTKVNVIITATNQNGSVYQLRSLIEAIVSEGTCTLTLTKGTTSVVRTATVQSNPSTSTCQGFDIPVSELSPGTWNASLLFENPTHKGLVTKDITIE